MDHPVPLVIPARTPPVKEPSHATFVRRVNSPEIRARGAVKIVKREISMGIGDKRNVVNVRRGIIRLIAGIKLV